MASLMAAASTSSAVTAPSTLAGSSSVTRAIEVPSMASFNGLKATSFSKASDSFSSRTVSNGSKVSAMLVWNPYDNQKFETLSYLFPLSDEQISKQVDYIVRQGWIPCLEFDKIGSVYREHFHGSGYYDGRYWTMWKLPMFGCNDPATVLREIRECQKAYPNCYIRVLGFDSKRQVQVSGFLVQKPTA